MRTSDFYYELPQELIAQDPLEDRSSSRLMHLSMADGSIEHRHFRDILDYLNEGDTLVINDTKVIPGKALRSQGRDWRSDRNPSSEKKRERYLGMPGKAWQKGSSRCQNHIW